MTLDEASKRYNIPKEILEEYISWGLCSTVCDIMGAWQCDSTDLERLSMVMTLHDIGFCKEEIETYMRLMIQGKLTEEERLHMLNRRRDIALDEIHFREKQLESLDYLRHEIRKHRNRSANDRGTTT